MKFTGASNSFSSNLADLNWCRESVFVNEGRINVLSI